VKIIMENFRKFLTEEKTKEEIKKHIFDLITHEDPGRVLQGMILAPVGAPVEYQQAIQKAVDYVASQFDILSSKGGLYDDFDFRDQKIIEDLYKKSFNIKSVEQLESFIAEYLKLVKYINDKYGPWGRYGPPLPDDFMGHGPDPGGFGYPETFKLKDFFNEKNVFVKHYVHHELKNILKDIIPKEEDDYGF